MQTLHLVPLLTARLGYTKVVVTLLALLRWLVFWGRLLATCAFLALSVQHWVW
jgi:hypothetical protein